MCRDAMQSGERKQYHAGCEEVDEAHRDVVIKKRDGEAKREEPTIGERFPAYQENAAYRRGKSDDIDGIDRIIMIAQPDKKSLYHRRKPGESFGLTYRPFAVTICADTDLLQRPRQVVRKEVGRVSEFDRRFEYEKTVYVPDDHPMKKYDGLLSAFRKAY